MKKYKDFTNFERDYKKKHKNCEYCEAMGEVRQSDVVVPRRIGETEYHVAICWRHYQILLEIEGI